ncbi:MAG: hypothetical protein JNL80_13365 [Phycisphaerae bacterium]|jgi:hypothetical protein|nr:hypothetical protein [Phycisphaerae bacterium]
MTDVNHSTADRPNDGAPNQLTDDVIHGLLAGLADRERIELDARGGPVDEPIGDSRSGASRVLLARALATAAMVALAVMLAMPFVGPQTATAAELVRTAQRHFATAARTYEIRVTKWGGPLARRLLTGEVEFRPGPPPTSEGYLIGGLADQKEGTWRVTFGRDASGSWVRGTDGVRRARPIVRQIVGDSDDPLPSQDVEAMTLDAVLSRLNDGYDLDVFGAPSMRTVIAKRRESTRTGPLRVELELARDGRTVERAKVEIARPGSPTVVELRLQARQEPSESSQS